MATPPAAASEADPIFSLLAAEGALWQRCLDLEEACDVHGGAPHDVQAEHDEVWRSHRPTFNAMVATVPTTRAGLDALVARFEEHIEGTLVDPDSDGLSPLLTTIRSFIAREV